MAVLVAACDQYFEQKQRYEHEHKRNVQNQAAANIVVMLEACQPSRSITTRTRLIAVHRNSSCRSVDPGRHSHSALCPNVLLLTILGLCGRTSGPEHLSSGCPRPECMRGRCSLLLPPNMPPDSVRFVRPTANSYLVSHLAALLTVDARCPHNLQHSSCLLHCWRQRFR
jgi:hypothetical protein